MHISPNSALFLDRDGVINHELHLDYVKNRGEFVFLPGAPEAIALLSQYFNKIFIATNQRGVSKGLMTEIDLHDVHQHMLEGIHAAGGRIDHIYYCTAPNNDHPDRKPNPGMALRAAADFPGINLEQSFMAGNNESDMAFGRQAGLQTIFLTTTRPAYTLPHPLVDFQFASLEELAHFVHRILV